MTNEEKIWSYLKAQGFSNAGAAGLMGNLYAESGLSPTNLQNTFEKKLGFNDVSYTTAVDSGKYVNFVHDSAGYGLCQWTYWSRKEGLLEFARASGKSIGDLEMQLDFMMKELVGYPALIAVLKSTGNVKEASDAVLTQFERPADQGAAVKNKRADYGKVYYDKYAGKAASTKDGSALKLVQSIMTKNPCYTAGRKIAVKGLMLHSVGCPQPSASVFIKSWNSQSYKNACVHGFIDANDGTAYQTLPWDYRGWHAGGAANNTHIGVEMCEPACIKYIGGATFTCSDKPSAQAAAKRTYDTAVLLFAMLCKQFGLDPLGDGVIVSHKEGCARGIASNHGDPEHLWTQLGMGYTMNGFRKDVKAAMSGVIVTASAVSELDQAVDKLAKLGVINSPDYWKKAAGSVKYLDQLIVKAAAKITGKGVRLTSAEAGIDRLVKDGIINSPDYWRLHYPDQANIDALLCALGGAKKG